jgi:molybdate transport system substrate-binding protein
VNALKILSGGAAEGLVEALRASFEARTGCKIDGAVGAMKARLLAGETTDVMILSRSLIDELVGAGHLVGQSARNIGAVETAIAVRKGHPMPAVGDQGELRAALDAADEIHLPDPEQATAGIHFARVMKRLGIEATDKLRPAPNGATAMRALAASTARQPIGCTQGDRDSVDSRHRICCAAASRLRSRDDLHRSDHDPEHAAGRSDRPARSADRQVGPQDAPATRLPLARHRLEASESGRTGIPSRPAPGEYSDPRLELGQIVERAGIEIDLVAHNLGATEHAAVAYGTGIAGGRPAAATRPAVAQYIALQHHSGLGKGDEACVTAAA